MRFIGSKHAGQEDVHKRKICSHCGKGSQISMQGRKMFTNAKYVHIVEKVPKEACRAGRCSQKLNMFTL